MVRQLLLKPIEISFEVRKKLKGILNRMLRKHQKAKLAAELPEELAAQLVADFFVAASYHKK